MCGIVACKLKRPLTGHDIKQMNALRDSMSYRGPDGYGQYISEEDGVYLGHRRLSIIDVGERSSQPMKQGSLVISYNGEVYNYREIAEELNDNSVAHSDTAVILRAWREWGAASLDKFDGMYAFALWDEDRKALTLATDPFGEKPLYKYENEHGVYFCSEARPLIEVFNLSFQPKDNEIADFLHLGYIRPPSTGFQGLENVGPASLVTIDSKNVFKAEQYWTMPDMHIGTGSVHPISASELKQIKEILCGSLEKRLRADVSIGLFLSGGVDSSLIAALAAKELGVELQTYTVGFPDGQDESDVASGIAKHLSLDHMIINSRESELWKDAPDQLCNLYGVPNDNLTALAVYQMCLVAKEHLTVALSGLGGDELFYGYNKHDTLYRLKNIYRHDSLMAFMGSAFKNLPVIGRKFDLLNKLTTGNKDSQYLRIKAGDNYGHLKNLFDKTPHSLIPADKRDIVHAVRDFDVLSSMPQSYIPAVDRGSMRASVEVRTPFLNRKLVNFVSALDQRALIHYGKKNVLRHILQDYMPLNLLSNGKQGFVFPAKRYFKEMSPPKPELPFLDQSELDNLWSNQSQDEYQSVMMRLSILHALSNSRSLVH